MFGDFSNEIITEIGFIRCAEVPHLYHHVKEQVSLEVHVDDFYAVGPGTAPERLLKQIGEHLTLLIEGPYNEGNPSFTHLKRRPMVTKEGVWIQPSANHLKKLLDICGLDEIYEMSKPRETPTTKEVATLEPSEPLQNEEIRRYRAIVGLLIDVHLH